MNQDDIQNPFYIFSVAGIYDSHDIPEADFYLEDAFQLLDDRLKEYIKTKLPCSILPILGRTGVGKTFLLRKLQRKYFVPNNANSHYLFIPISPLAVLDLNKTVGDVLWEQVESFLRKEIYVEQLEEVCPMDIFAYKIVKALFEGIKSNEKSIKLRWFSRECLSSEHLVDFESFIQLKQKHNKVLWKELSKRVKSKIMDTDEMNLYLWVLGQCFSQKTHPDLNKLDSITKIGKLCLIGKKIHLAPVLVFDQLEDLEILGEKLIVQSKKFLLRIFDFERNIQKKIAEGMMTPLLIVSMFVEDLKDASLSKHVEDRLPRLSNGKTFVDLEGSLRSFEDAYRLANCYFLKYREKSNLIKHSDLNARWERLSKQLEDVYQSLLLSGDSRTPRVWIRTCYDLWKNPKLYVNQEIKEKLSKVEGTLEAVKPFKTEKLADEKKEDLKAMTKSRDIEGVKGVLNTKTNVINETDIYKLSEHISDCDYFYDMKIKKDQEDCLKVLGALAKAASEIKGFSFRDQTGPRTKSYVKLEINGQIVIIGVSTKRKKDDCLKKWQELRGLVAYRPVFSDCKLLLVQTLNTTFPSNMPGFAEKQKIYKHKLRELAHWLFVFCLIKSTNNLGEISGCKTIDKQKINDLPDVSKESLEKMIDEWDFFDFLR